MPDRTGLLALKRDVGTISDVERTELDASLAEAEARMRDATALVSGEGGGCLAVPAVTLLPSTWDCANGGNAKALAEWEAKYRDTTYEPAIAAGLTLDTSSVPPDFMDKPK